MSEQTVHRFSLGIPPSPADLIAFYRDVLDGHTPKPKVSFGPGVSIDDAKAELERIHLLYRSAVGDKRSSVLQSMKINDRVEIVE